MNKPEPLRFEYEKLFDKDGEFAGYKLNALHKSDDYPVRYFYLSGFGRSYPIFYCGFLAVDQFNPFKAAVHKYNAKNCKEPEVDTRHELVNKFKQALKPDYFVEKK